MGDGRRQRRQWRAMSPSAAATDAEGMTPEAQRVYVLKPWRAAQSSQTSEIGLCRKRSAASSAAAATHEAIRRVIDSSRALARHPDILATSSSHVPSSCRTSLRLVIDRERCAELREGPYI